MNRPTRTPKELLVEARRAESAHAALAQEAAEAERRRSPRATEARARAAEAKAKADAASAAFEAGRREWEDFHAAEEAERRAAEEAVHHARLREVHRDNPDHLRALGIEPAPEPVVTYPQKP